MAGNQFYFRTGKTGRETGPFLLDEVRKLVQEGKVKKSQYVRRGVSGEWTRAEESLAKVFEQVEALRKREQEAFRAQRLAEQLEQAAVLDSESHPLTEEPGPEKSRPAVPAIPASGFWGPILRRLFAGVRPSSYFGFQIQGYVINIAIGLAMAGAVAGCLFSLVLAAMALFMAPGFGAKMTGCGLMLAQSVGALISGTLTVSMLVFFRSVIDWMVDMESHARSLRSQAGNGA